MLQTNLNSRCFPSKTLSYEIYFALRSIDINSKRHISTEEEAIAADNTSMKDRLFVASCFHLPDPDFDKVPERLTVNLVTATINIIASPFVVMSNSSIVFAIFATSRLRTPSKLFIWCLVLSDVFVGLAVQPSYICFRLMENQHRSVPCSARVIIYSNTFFVCCGVSFITLSSVAYERLVAVRIRARYNDVFTGKRVLKFMAVIWILNILLTSL